MFGISLWHNLYLLDDLHLQQILQPNVKQYDETHPLVWFLHYTEVMLKLLHNSKATQSPMSPFIKDKVSQYQNTSTMEAFSLRHCLCVKGFIVRIDTSGSLRLSCSTGLVFYVRTGHLMFKDVAWMANILFTFHLIHY